MESKKQVTALRETKTGRKLIASAEPVYDSYGNIKQIVTFSREITGFYILKNKLSEIEEAVQRNFTATGEWGQESDDLDGYVVKSPAMTKVIQNIIKPGNFRISP